MKKMVAVLMTMVMVMVMVNCCHAEGIEENWCFNGTKIFNEKVYEEFVEAFEKGEILFGTACLYENMLYDYEGGMNITALGYEGPIEGSASYEMEEFLMDLLRTEKAPVAEVIVRLIGCDNCTNEDVYYVEILMDTNINDYKGEKSGSGHLGDGLFYYGVRYLVRMY